MRNKPQSRISQFLQITTIKNVAVTLNKDQILAIVCFPEGTEIHMVGGLMYSTKRPYLEVIDWLY